VDNVWEGTENVCNLFLWIKIKRVEFFDKQ
jgi:hypothetical protein